MCKINKMKGVDYIKKYIKMSVELGGIGFFVYALWIWLELMLEGKIVASKSDSIMSVILMYSLYFNYKNYMNKKGE